MLCCFKHGKIAKVKTDEATTILKRFAKFEATKPHYMPPDLTAQAKAAAESRLPATGIYYRLYEDDPFFFTRPWLIREMRALRLLFQFLLALLSCLKGKTPGEIKE